MQGPVVPSLTRPADDGVRLTTACDMGREELNLACAVQQVEVFDSQAMCNLTMPNNQESDCEPLTGSEQVAHAEPYLPPPHNALLGSETHPLQRDYKQRVGLMLKGSEPVLVSWWVYVQPSSSSTVFAFFTVSVLADACGTFKHQCVVTHTNANKAYVVF